MAPATGPDSTARTPISDDSRSLAIALGRRLAHTAHKLWRRSMKTTLQNGYYYGAVGSLLALIALCVAWELVLAPLRPGGSWLVLKVVPLLLPLRGVLKRDLYTMQWSSMLILLYLRRRRGARHQRPFRHLDHAGLD